MSDTDASSPADRTPNKQVVKELSVMQEEQGLPDWVRFEANSRIGFVTMDVATLDELTGWARALGHNDEPTRYTYADESVIRYNARWADPLSGWRFDLNARLVIPPDIAPTDDFLDALELVNEAAVR